MQKGPEIHNPSIQQVHPGMMIRAREEYGAIIVQGVAVEQEKVLVRCFVGGTKEESRWIPIAHVYLVWWMSVNTYDEAMEKIADFGREVERTLRAREALDEWEEKWM